MTQPATSSQYGEAAQGGYKNLAPIEPLQKLGESDRSFEVSSFAQMAREWHLDIVNRNIEERREIAETGRAMANLRSGKLIMQRDPIHGALTFVKPLPHKARRDRHVYPLAQVNSSQLTSIWTLSRPKAVPRHFGNTNRSQIQASMIEKVSAHYDVEMFDDEFHQKESLSMMDYGTSGIRLFYDKAINTIRSIQPVIQNADKTIHEGYGFCLECQSEGVEEDFRSAIDLPPRCKECGSYNVSDLVPKQIVSAAEVIGRQVVEQGDLGAELLKIPACNWDMRVLMHDSSYFAYRSEVPRRFVQSVLGIDIATEDPDTDFGLRVINELGTRGGSIEGWGRDNLYGNSSIEDKAVMDEEWFDPEWYHGQTLSKDERTISGEVIPAGVPLQEIFPDGLCLTGFNDMSVLVSACNEKRRIVGSVYHIQSFSGVGKGTQDAIEISEQLNIAHSAAIEQIKRIGAGGGVAYDKAALTPIEARSLLKPGKLVGINLKNTNHTSVDSAIKRIEVGELSQSNLGMIAQLTNMLNISFQTTDFTSGVADDRVDVNTLGGQQLLMSQNQQRSAAPLRMKGWSRARVFEHVIELFREHIKLPKYFGTTDKFALTKGRMISGAELPEKIRFDFVPDSEQPTNDVIDRQNAADMLEKSQHFGIPFIELAKTEPRIAAWWASRFKVDLPTYNYDEMLIVCQDRLDNLKEIVAEAQQIAELVGIEPDGQASELLIDQLSRPITAGEENLAVKAQILGEYLDDDEVSEWSPMMHSAMQALIKRHYVLDRDFRIGLQGLEQEGQIGLQMQAAQAQMQMQMQQQQMQAQMAAPQQAAEAQQALIDEGLNRAAGLVEEEEKFSRDQEGKDRDHQRNIELEQIRQQGRTKNSPSKNK